MTENNTFESRDQVKQYFDHLTLDTWQLAIGYMCIAEKQGKNYSWLHRATPPYWGFLLPSASHLPLGCGSPQELQTCRKRLSLPNLQSPLNFLYLVQTGLSVFPWCNWKKADIHACLHAAVGCMVKALTMNTPSFRANCLPCKAVGIGSTFVHDLDGLFIASCLKFWSYTTHNVHLYFWLARGIWSLWGECEQAMILTLQLSILRCFCLHLAH